MKYTQSKYLTVEQTNFLLASAMEKLCRKLNSEHCYLVVEKSPTGKLQGFVATNRTATGATTSLGNNFAQIGAYELSVISKVCLEFGVVACMHEYKLEGEYVPALYLWASDSVAVGTKAHKILLNLGVVEAEQ